MKDFLMVGNILLLSSKVQNLDIPDFKKNFISDKTEIFFNALNFLYCENLPIVILIKS